MFDFSFSMAATVAVTFFGAGVIKGVTGMGLPTVAMGVLGALISPLTAAGLMLIPSFVTNAWQLLAGPSFAHLLRRLGMMMIAIVAGTSLGAGLLVHGDTRITTAALGAALVAYSSYALLAPGQIRVPAMVEPWASAFAGLVTGVVSGGTGVFVVPAVPYVQALGLEKEELVQALGLSFTVSTIALAAALAGHGVYQLDHLALSSMATAPALAGMWAGQFVRGKVSPPLFRKCFLICLLFLGLEQMSRLLR